MDIMSRLGISFAEPTIVPAAGWMQHPVLDATTLTLASDLSRTDIAYSNTEVMPKTRVYVARYDKKGSDFLCLLKLHY